MIIKNRIFSGHEIFKGSEFVNCEFTGNAKPNQTAILKECKFGNFKSKNCTRDDNSKTSEANNIKIINTKLEFVDLWSTVKKYKNTNESQEYEINSQAFKAYYPTLFEQFQKWVKNTSIVPYGEYIKITPKWLSEFHLQNLSSSQTKTSEGNRINLKNYEGNIFKSSIAKRRFSKKIEKLSLYSLKQNNDLLNPQETKTNWDSEMIKNNNKPIPETRRKNVCDTLLQTGPSN